MSFSRLVEIALAMTLVVNGGFAAGGENKERVSHDGLVVSISGDELVMKSDEGADEHTHTLAPRARMSCDGKACKSKDLKAGMHIRVTTHGDDTKVAYRVEAIEQHSRFASHEYEGKVVRISGRELTMTDDGDNSEHICTLMKDAEVTCDGEDFKSADLKAGMRIRVTTAKKAPHAATSIESLDKNSEFAVLEQDGKVVRIDDQELTMTDDDGQNERTIILAKDVKVTCDARDSKSVDLKPGMRIRVTTAQKAPHSASHVEALDKNRKFVIL